MTLSNSFPPVRPTAEMAAAAAAKFVGISRHYHAMQFFLAHCLIGMEREREKQQEGEREREREDFSSIESSHGRCEERPIIPLYCQTDTEQGGRESQFVVQEITVAQTKKKS